MDELVEELNTLEGQIDAPKEVFGGVLAYANYQQVIGFNFWDVLHLNAIVYDTNGWFDVNTQEYVPPVDGYVFLEAQVMLMDGTVRFISNDIDPDVFKALMTIGGGERIPRF